MSAIERVSPLRFPATETRGVSTPLFPASCEDQAELLANASNKQRAKLEVWFAEVELISAAVKSGWKISRRIASRDRGTSYSTLSREGETIVLRVADHLPARPVGGDEIPMLLALVGSPNGLYIAREYLQRPAAGLALTE